MRGEIKLIFGMFLLVLLLGSVSAGVGIKWVKESALVKENSEVCMTYYVYNPFTKDSNLKIGLSDELQEIATSSFSETKRVPAETSSDNAVPIEFCFETPRVYERDCLLFDSLICEQKCEEPMKVYEGEVEVLEVSQSAVSGGSGSSATALSTSAPLRVKVQCIPHGRNYSLIYVVLALISGILLIISFWKDTKKKKKKRG